MNRRLNFVWFFKSSFYVHKNKSKKNLLTLLLVDFICLTCKCFQFFAHFVNYALKHWMLKFTQPYILCKISCCLLWIFLTKHKPFNIIWAIFRNISVSSRWTVDYSTIFCNYILRFIPYKEILDYMIQLLYYKNVLFGNF